MKNATNHSWKQSWSKAIKDYTRALKEFPNDTNALVGLGAAYLETDQLESAREIFERLQSAIPGDPSLLTHLANLEERDGNVSQAVAHWLECGDALEEQGNLQEAVNVWTRVMQLDPLSLEASQKLGRAYADEGRNEEAVAAYIAAARGFQASGQTTEMVRVLRSALRLDPGDSEATELLSRAHVAGGIEQGLFSDDAGPIETAKRAAWAELAQMLFEDLSLEMMSDTDVVPAEARLPIPDSPEVPVDRSRVVALIGRAVDLDSKGHADGAVQAYQEVVRAGVDRVAVHFSLGLLYKSQGHLEEACRHLSSTKFHPDYALASHLALGECYQVHNRLDLAMQNYVHALKIADLQVANEMRVPEVVAVYDNMLDSYGQEGRYGRQESVLVFFRTVRGFFHRDDWLERTVHLRTYLDELCSVGATISLADGLRVRDFDAVFEIMTEVRSLVNRGLLLTGREECYRALEREPEYLPFHFFLADVFVRQGMVEDAVAKYMVIAELYEVSGSLVQASSVYKSVLSLTPLDVKVRAKLIDLLINRKEIDQALEQYLALADAYYQLARVDKALETFNEALRLSERSESATAYRLKILYFMADLYTQRVEWGKAAEIYNRIRSLDADDYQAGLYLMDLHFKQGNTEQGIRELQKLLQPYEARKDNEKIVEILREAVRLRSNELALRARLSRAFIESGMKQEAIVELDAIGEMQLEADMRDEAIQTIRLIISLKPANARAYKQLLYHLLS